MAKTFLCGLLLAASALTPAHAQESDAATGRSSTELYQRGYNSATTGGQPPHPAEAAQVASVNNAANAATAGNVGGVSAVDQAQYEADREAYMTALVQHDRAVNRSDARYVRQQVAYADAMSAWRVQVAACKRGNRKACDLPPPNVADYY